MSVGKKRLLAQYGPMLYLVHQCKLILQGSNQKSRHPSRARSWQSNNTERALGKRVEESKRE